MNGVPATLARVLARFGWSYEVDRHPRLGTRCIVTDDEGHCWGAMAAHEAWELIDALYQLPPLPDMGCLERHIAAQAAYWGAGMSGLIGEVAEALEQHGDAAFDGGGQA